MIAHTIFALLLTAAVVAHAEEPRKGDTTKAGSLTSWAIANEIHEATKAQNVVLIESLLQADPGLVNARDSLDQSPIHLAARLPDAAVLALLLEHGADVNAVDAIQATPLHSASAGGLTDHVRLLIAGGADFNAVNGMERTPLYFAAANGHCEVVRLLLNAGANPDLNDAEGVLPHQIASQNGWQLVADLLRQKTERRTNAKTASGPCDNLEELFSSKHQWTGVAVSAEGRVFVNYPRWSPLTPISVAELLPSGEVRPYPDSVINLWDEKEPVDSRFVCVQSVVCDDRDNLWILDTGNPYITGVRDKGAKLVQVSLSDDRIVRIVYFDSLAAPSGSYLNDLRIDSESGFVYVTDSNLGALLVLNLNTGGCRRVLENHFSTSAEDTEMVVAGVALVESDGSPVKVHSDGIALSPDRKYLYYQAMTGRTLYRIPTRALRDADLPDSVLARHVETVANSGICDGMMFDSEGRLYFSFVERSAIERLNPDGRFELLAQDPKICWPDSFARMPDGSMCFTTSRLHEQGVFRDEFKIYRFTAR